jgi:hypothetical protein
MKLDTRRNRGGTPSAGVIVEMRDEHGVVSTLDI